MSISRQEKCFSSCNVNKTEPLAWKKPFKCQSTVTQNSGCLYLTTSPSAWSFTSTALLVRFLRTARYARLLIHSRATELMGQWNIFVQFFKCSGISLPSEVRKHLPPPLMRLVKLARIVFEYEINRQNRSEHKSFRGQRSERHKPIPEISIDTILFFLRIKK